MMAAAGTPYLCAIEDTVSPGATVIAVPPSQFHSGCPVALTDLAGGGRARDWACRLGADCAGWAEPVTSFGALREANGLANGLSLKREASALHPATANAAAPNTTSRNGARH